MNIEYIEAKKIIQTTSKKNRDFWFSYDYNMNIYRGCNHGCIYCDSRGDCYGIKDFDKVSAKKNAIKMIDEELKGKRKKGVVGTGAMSDPYNPLEKSLELTRQSIELICKYDFGLGITTKSDLITRDIDILKKIQKKSPLITKLSISTYDDDLSKIIEPYAPTSSKRFKAIEKMSREGLYTGVLMMPILPFIEDNEKNITEILNNSLHSGARFIFAGLGVSLRDGQRDFFYQQLDKHFIGLKEEYIKKFRNNYQCSCEKSERLRDIIYNFCEKHSLDYKMKDIVQNYKDVKPIETQLSLFENF